MQNAHRMPLICRRLFATSLSASSKSRRGVPELPPATSAFSERFGGPTQAQDAQATFPAWPGAQTTQQSSHVNPLSLRPPPSGLVGSENGTKAELESTQDSAGRKRPVKRARSKEKKRELFSDIIGNASAFTNTSSFEAKLAIEPAAETYKRWMLAAKDNAERFKPIPKPAIPRIEESDPAIRHESGRPASDDVPTSKDPTTTSELLSKTPMRASRSPIVTPSGRRMLSTVTTDSTLCPSQPVYQAEIPLAPRIRPISNTPLWKDCVRWMLSSALDLRPCSHTAMSGFMRRLCTTWPRSTQPLSFFQPAFHPSIPMFMRGYATHRASKPRTNSRQPSTNLPELDSPYILIPEPTTQLALCNALRHLFQSTEPPISLPRLIATHARYSTLQSLRSFNLLLGHAIRVAPTPYTEQILAQMRMRGIPWGKNTERLVVRAHIQSGRWLEAIRLAEKLWLDGATSQAPLDIFAELLHFTLTRKASINDVAIMANRCWKLFPSGVSTDAVDKSPRLTFNVTRLLVNLGRYDDAAQLARKLFESLDSPTPRNVRFCREIVRYIIRPPLRDRRSPHPPRFLDRQALFESLLSHNPSLNLIPDASLTVALLENHFRARNRGLNAFHTLKEMRSKYGPHVENGAARRLIARYAIEEGRIDVAREMFERERLARLEESSGDPSELFPRVPWVTEGAVPTPSHLDYLRHIGTENQKWIVVARRLRREEAKVGLVQTPNLAELTPPENLLASEKRALSIDSVSPGRIRRKAARRAVRLRRGVAMR